MAFNGVSGAQALNTVQIHAAATTMYGLMVVKGTVGEEACRDPIIITVR